MAESDGASADLELFPEDVCVAAVLEAALVLPEALVLAAEGALSLTETFEESLLSEDKTAEKP